jgi:hypothetical protein
MIGAPKQSLDPALLPTAEYLEQNPVPAPEFFIKPADFSARPNCFEIDGTALWEVGDLEPSEQNLSDYVANFRKHFQITIDDIAVPDEKLEIEMHLAPAYVFDNHHNIIGRAAYWPICFGMEYLSNGLHIASVETTTTSGIKHSYSWAFRVTNTTPEVPTIVVLSSLTPSGTTEPSPSPAATDSSLVPRPSSL